MWNSSWGNTEEQLQFSTSYLLHATHCTLPALKNKVPKFNNNVIHVSLHSPHSPPPPPKHPWDRVIGEEKNRSEILFTNEIVQCDTWEYPQWPVPSHLDLRESISLCLVLHSSCLLVQHHPLQTLQCISSAIKFMNIPRILQGNQIKIPAKCITVRQVWSHAVAVFWVRVSLVWGELAVDPPWPRWKNPVLHRLRSVTTDNLVMEFGRQCNHN